MSRANVYLPDAVHARALAAGLNLSATLRNAITEILDQAEADERDCMTSDAIALHGAGAP